jgi:squalene-hopene/tetraprenyl-beta-curcumene cyclase
VKAYYALKLAGDALEARHMVEARAFILAAGGAARANVFTRITLALFGQVAWRDVPFMPVEAMLLPRWFPFHIDKISHWSRAVMIPLSILCTLRARAVNPRAVHVPELFTTPAREERDVFPATPAPNRAFLSLERAGRLLEPMVPRLVRRRAIRRARDWFVERLDGVDGLGAIFPATVNAHEALGALGYGPEHRWREQSREALRRLLVFKEDHAFCQPFMSPLRDTALACLALREVDGEGDTPEVLAGLHWLATHLQPGESGNRCGDARGGGGALQPASAYHPDAADMPLVAEVLLDADGRGYGPALSRTAERVRHMQSSNGGWGRFDVDNTLHVLEEMPFADHGALLGPPTADVTGHCITFLARLDCRVHARAIERGIAFLRREQEADGSWFGRWGTNYIYGTWSVLRGLVEAGVPPEDPVVRRAVAWLKARQRDDGGWGEDHYSYFEPALAGEGARRRRTPCVVCCI